MTKIHPFENDDANDTRLFAEMQRYVLEHYPNFERVGCLDHETLTSFVANPSELDLSDPKYLHILQCAECARDLIELRRSRDVER